MATIEVNNWAEFVVAVGTEGATVECPENALWDMNEISPNSWTTIQWKATQVNGNGTTIRNIYSNTTTLQLTAESQNINGLNFENIYQNGGYFVDVQNKESGDVSQRFTNGRFSGVIINGVFMHSPINSYSSAAQNRRSIFILNGSINLMFGGDSVLTAGTVYDIWDGKKHPRPLRLRNCIIKLSGYSTNSGTAITGQDGGYNAITLNNSLLIGVNPFKNLQISQGAWGESTTSSIIDLQMSEGQQLYVDPNNAGTISTTFINSDKINGATVPSQLIQSTTEQLHNATYLAENGFPIGVD